MIFRVRTFLVASFAVLFVAGSGWFATVDAAESAALTLPDETIAALRLPALGAFGDALRERTKLGKTLFSDEKLAGYMSLIEEQGGEEWKEALGHLERFSLKPEDLHTLAKGDLGAAIAAIPREDRSKAPIALVLVWMEPEADLADRLYAAVEQFIEEDQQDEMPIKRVDLNLAGYPVMQLRMASVTREAAEMEEAFPDIDNEQAVQEYLEKQARLQAEAKVIQVDQVNIFVTRRENRLLVGFTLPDNVARNYEEGETPDFDAISGAEAATNVFGKFLSLQDGGETGIVPKALSAPGVAGALPPGEIFMEAFLDTAALVAMLETAPKPEVAQGMERFGLHGLGPVVYRTTLDGNVARATAVVSAPQPRGGLLSLFEQEAQPSEPADWVPNSVMGYGHFSFDLVQLYDLIKQFSSELGGVEATASFETLDRQCNALFQADFATILASLGKRHTVVSLVPNATETAPPAGDDELFRVVKAPTRSAFVWQLGNEDVWKKIIQLGANFASSTDGAMEAAEEQGFTGLRLTTPTQDGGVFVGRNYLVLGLGSNVIEPLLSSLRNPPALDESLRGSPAMARARELMPLEPGIAFQLSDQAKTLPVQRQVLINSFDQQLRMLDALGSEGAEAEEAKAFIEKLKGVIPSEEELQGILGVSVAHGAVNEQGLIFSTASELPAP